MGDQNWDGDRWVRILDRIEYRQPRIGLRFWGPPLWLEVTMSGPDSESWSTAGGQTVTDRSWDWQSSAPCPDIAAMVEAGVEDDRLLTVAARYTLENLVLNSVHEIGEWLRFDSRRLYPPHGIWDASDEVQQSTQGNGSVYVSVVYDPPPAGARLTEAAVDDSAGRSRLRERAAQVASPWRFTYLPATAISYSNAGPSIVSTACGDHEITLWSSSWSESALAAVKGSADHLTEEVQRDVHRMFCEYETDTICRALYVDGHRPWVLGGVPRRGPAVPNCDDARPIRLSISYQPT